MKKNRRILALLIAMVMMLTDVSGIWAASENVQNATSETEENISSEETKVTSSAEGEGTVGSLLAEELQQEFTRTQAEAYISDLTVEGQTVTVSYATNVQADLAVGIFTEDGKSLLASGHTLVEETSEQTSAQIELSEAPPEYFRASAYLLDAETREPVCEAYNTQYYTSDIQDLMDKTASDFEDTGRMIYLDTGVATNQEENFAVYKDGVVSVEESDTANILIINADGTWTIEKADTTVKSLKEGDIFSFRYKDGMVDALQIKKITVESDTVTLSEGTDADLGDIFEYVRIHTEGSARMTDMDVSGISSELTFEGVSEGGTETDDAQVETQSLDAAGASKDKVTELDKEKPEISFGLYAKGEKWKAKGSVELSFLETDVDFCLSGSSKYIKAFTGWELSLSASFEGSIEKTLEMGYFGFSPVAGVYITITPVATFKVTGSLEISGLSMHSTVGMRYDGSKQNLSTGPELKKNLRISGSLSVSVGLEIGVTILTEKGLSLKLTGEVGAEIKAGNQGPALSTSVMKHSCANCLDIQINVTVSVEIELTFLGERLMPAPGTFLELTINVGTAYYSVDYDAFGWGECPHSLYKTDFVVTEKSTEQPVADAEVEFELIKEKKEADGKATLNEWQDTAQMTTDENGICTIFLASGDYKTAFNKDSLTAEKEFTVSGKESTYSVEMDERVYSITYNIKDKKGIAQRGAEVTATDSKGEATKATADGSGKANLQLIGGAYDIEIHSGDLEKKFSTKVSRNLEMDVKLHGPAYKVTVSVTEESGNPVAGANIAGLDSEKENVLDDSAVTDKDGKAEVYLEDGDYTLQVTRTRDSLEGETSITVNGEEQEIAVIVYTKRTITVQIKDESGNPVENAGVIAVSGDKRYDGITDRNGNAELVLARGTWELTGKKGELSGNENVAVEGEDKTVSMTLYAQKYHVELSASADKKLTSNICYVYTENGWRKTTLKWGSDADASKRTLELKAGRYRLEYLGQAGSDSYYSMTGWIQVDSNMTRTIYPTKYDFTYKVEGQTLYVDGRGRLPLNRVLSKFYDPDSYDITRIVVGSGIEAIEYQSKTYFTDEKNALGKIEEIVLPSTLKVIDNGSFNMFTGLKNMEIPSGVIYMGYNYFPSSMENLTLYGPTNLTEGMAGYAENLILDIENVNAGSIEMKNLVVTDRVKTIGKFSKKIKLETVSLGNGITELPDDMFYGCTALQNVKLSEKLKMIPGQAFYNCVALKKVEMPDEATTVEEKAFYNCSALEKIEIPDKVTTIKAETFGNCESLAEVKLSQNLYSIGVKAFWYCRSLKTLELPASLRVLEQDEKGYSGTFGHSGLVEITIPKTVQETGTSMFEWCSSLERLAVLGGENSGLDKWGYTGTTYPCMEELTLDIPEIGIYSEYVPGLKKLVLGNRVEKIPDKAWSRAERLSSGWSKLEEIVWPEHLSYLGDTDFSELTSLKELNMPASIDEYKEAAIIKVPSSLTKMVVSEGIEEIKAYACYGGNKETVILPKSLKKIGDSAFMYASSLKEVVFPEDSELTTVESCAFWGCDSLEKITLGKKVERIGSWAFRNCKGLKEATIQSGCSGNDDYMDVVDVFWGSDSLETLTLGSENVWFGKDYGSYYDGTSMENLKHVILLDTVKKVLNGSSESIETVDMGNGVEELGEGAFYRCRNLKSVILSGNLTEIPDQTFKECTSLEEIEIPDGVTHIGILTFFSCSKLKKVELPGSLKTIGSAAFRYCTALKEIELPEGLEKIEKRAFTCTELETVTIPSTVSTIGEHAFENLTIKRICFKKLKGNQLYINMSKMLQCFAHYFANEEYTDLDDESFHDMIKDDPDFIKALKSINQKIIIYYPSSENISETDKAKANLQYCTWIPYTGSLDDPATFAVLDEESHAVAGDSGFSDGISETETTVADPEADTADQSYQEEELEVSGEEENFGDGTDSNGSDEASVEEAEDSGELIVSELEKPVAEAAEDFTSGSAELVAAGAASGDLQKQTYTGLVGNSNCFFAVVRDKNAKDFFASSNLLFMTQVTSDEDGNVTVEYRTEKNAGIPVLYGPEKTYDLSGAEVTVTEGMIYTGEEQKPAVTVVCGGEVLTEDKDYVLKGDTAFTDAGTYKIKVVGRKDYKGSVEKEYQVAKAGQKMTLEVSSRELKAGEKATITATAIGSLSYASRQPQVASVDAKGVITAKSPGVASVVVTAAGDKNHGAVKKNLLIFVTGSGNQNNGTPTPAPKKSVLKVTVSSLTLQKKQKTAALKVYGMVKGDYVKSVTSGNKNKVKVTSFTKTGKITLQAQKQTGKTTITIRLANGAKKNITVKVQAGKVKTSKISINKTAKVRKGKKVTLKPSLTPVTSQEKVTYASSNKKIVTVTSKGVIKGIRPGKAKITVRSGKKKVVVTVTVTK